MEANWGETDERILHLLRVRSLRAADEIAREVDIAEREVKERVEALESAGAIERYFPVLDPRLVGFPIVSYTFVECRETYDEALKSTIKHIPQWQGIQSAVVVLGSYDIIIRKISRSLTDLDLFTTNALDQPDSYFHDPETYTLTQIHRAWGIDFPTDGTINGRVPDLTDLDVAVLEALMEDARLRNNLADLADEIGHRPEETLTSIKKLEESGAIRGYSVNLDTKVLGWIRAFVGISTLKDSYWDVVNQLRKEDSSVKRDCLHLPYIFSGLGFQWASIAAELFIGSLDHLDRLTDNIRNLSGIQSTRTHLATKTLQDDVSISLR